MAPPAPARYRDLAHHAKALVREPRLSRLHARIVDAAVELETGDGTKRVIGPGEILLAEDLTGRGHISRAVDGRPRRSIVVTVD